MFVTQEIFEIALHALAAPEINYEALSFKSPGIDLRPHDVEHQVNAAAFLQRKALHSFGEVFDLRLVKGKGNRNEMRSRKVCRDQVVQFIKTAAHMLPTQFIRRDDMGEFFMQAAIACHYLPDRFEGDIDSASVDDEEISRDFFDETKFGRGVSLTAVFVLTIATNSDQSGNRGRVSLCFPAFSRG